MIRYKIISTNTTHQPKSSLTRRPHPSEPSYKETVLTRALQSNNFKNGDRVKMRRGHRRGNITVMHTNPETVNWERNTPHYIQVKFDDGAELMCHHSQLKRSKI